MINKGYFSYKNKYNKEYGYEKEKSHNLKQISKDTGVSMKGLQQIYNKGIGAYKTNPSSVRPSVKSKEQWAMARVYSSVMGGKASKIDANELKMKDGGKINYGSPKVNMSDISFIHETSKEIADKILKEGFIVSKNDNITKGVYTIPIVYKKESFNSQEIELEVFLKPNSKIFWTNTKRPMDFYYGVGNNFFNALFIKLGGNQRDNNRIVFLRNMEKWLSNNGYCGIQQGGEIVITDLSCIESIQQFERQNTDIHIRYKAGGKVDANELKMAKGGGVGNFPAKGELVNKENYLVKYEKIGNQYEFYVYQPITKSVSDYEQKKYVCVNQNSPLKMSYNQFINYLYAETYLDDLEYAEGGGVSSKINLLHKNTKTYEDLSKIKGQVVNDLPKSKSVPEIDIQIVDSLNFEGKGKKINNSKDAYIIFNDLWDKEKMVVHEEMNVLFVNKANNVIGYYKHSKGGIDGTVADVEMICSLAVKSLAKGVLIAHNHPSGNLIPSNADIQVSKELKDALKLFRISLIDSIIITKDNYKSLADESLFDIGGRVEGVDNFSLARFEDFDEEDERENEENEKGAILLEAIEYGRKTLDQNLLPKLLANTELSNIIFIYLSKYKEFNLYKLGWRIQFGLSKKWVGLCSVKEYEKMGVGKESKNRNLYLSSQFHKYDKNWKTNIKETVHHEMAHAVVRELFYFSDDTFGVWSRFSEIDPLNEQTEGHGKIWEMICNTILEGGGCSRYIEGLDLEVQFKDWKYECFNCGTKKFGNRSNFATKCVTCGKSVLIQKNKY